ncbi:MAG: hypothetical protein P8J20_19800 [Novosphingobium sp.]|nr:hypothetical protein [Novosphingobium sp.]
MKSMRSIFNAAVLHAPWVLFVVALIILVTGPLPLFIGGQDTMQIEAIGLAIHASLAGALWPFLGAALLWRIDRHWKGSLEVPDE